MSNDVTEVRRDNLRSLIAEKYNGVAAAFCRATGRNTNLINLILSDNGAIRRNMGEKLARGIEQDLGLPSLWFDVPRTGGPVERIATVPIVRLDALDKAGLERLVVGQDIVSRNVDNATSLAALRGVYATDGEMAPAISKGDLLLVDTGVKEFDRPGVYVITRGRDVFIRRVTKLLTGGIRIAADSDPGSAVEPQPGQFDCAGRVVGAMRFIEI